MAWALCLLVVAGALIGVWAHRMLIDDGLIHLRVVQQIRSGNGPVFNAGQRVEVSSSPAWVWILAIGDLLLPLRLDYLAFALSLIATGAAVSAPLWGRVVPAPSDRSSTPLPAAAIIVALSPAFAAWASGALEGALVYLWLAGCWVGALRLVRSRTFDPRFGLLIGSGALVRQEYVVLSVAMLLVTTAVVSERRVSRMACWTAGSLVPALGYQVFRMAYYGQLAPNASVAKDVGEIRLGVGWDWLESALRSSGLWIPLLVVAALNTAWWIGAPTSERWVWAGFVGGSTLALAVIVAAGGDFLGSRFAQPWFFALCLPVLFVAVPTNGSWASLLPKRLPPRKPAVAAASVTISLLGALALCRVDPLEAVNAGPILAASPDVPKAESGFIGATARPAPWPSPGLYTAKGDRIESVRPPHTEMYELAIGLKSVIQRPQLEVLDAVALADPVGSHLQPRSNTGVRIPGHEKLVTRSWVLARAGDVIDYEEAARQLSVTALAISTVAQTERGQVERDTRRMRQLFAECEPLRDMLDAANAPMSIGRAWKNLVGSVSRTTRRFDGDPTRLRAASCPAVQFSDERQAPIAKSAA